MHAFYLPSNGAGQIYCRVWMPETEPKGILQLVHGIAEHISRYDQMANFFTDKGLIVCGEDHMGHGRSIEEGTQGYFSNGWTAVVEDTYSLTLQMQREYPQLPYVILGHSMGSFLVRTLLHQHPEARLSGAILSGTGWIGGVTLKLGKQVVASAIRHQGDRAVSKTVNQLMFGSYNNKMPEHRTGFDWLTTVQSEVDAYIRDPYCGFDATNGLARDLLSGMEANESKAMLGCMNKALPVYFYAGEMDPVGNMGKGVAHTYRAFRNAGMESVTLKLYPGKRHELHNEDIRSQVFADVYRWMKGHCEIG